VLGVAIKLAKGRLPSLSADDAFNYVNYRDERGIPTREELQAYFRQRGSQVDLPRFLNYELLTSRGFADFKGVQVPHLVFESDDNGRRVKLAHVYLVTSKQFNLADLGDEPQERREDGYTFKVELRPTNGGRQACVICFTGEDWNWLKKPNPQV
jgi:hypothetical protein